MAGCRGPGLLVGHLEEEQEGDLLHERHIAHAIIPQDMGEVPGFSDDLLGVAVHGGPCVGLVFLRREVGSRCRQGRAQSET